MKIIYILEASLRGLTFCKIGIGMRAEDRAATIASSSPFPVRLAATLPANDACKIERSAHAALMLFHSNGEWFECSVALAVETVQSVTGKQMTILPPDENPLRIRPLLTHSQRCRISALERMNDRKSEPKPAREPRPKLQKQKPAPAAPPPRIYHVT